MLSSRTRGLAVAATLFLMGINGMSNHAVSFESSQTGVTPEGWTATLTGSAGLPIRCS
jgi:hypothetical protein